MIATANGDIAPDVGMNAVERPERLRPVLVADDDRTTRTYLASLVQKLGYSVVAAANGEEAWSMFEAIKPELVVVDWIMPKVDGLELCRRIRASVGEDAFVLVVTSRSESEDLQSALLAGVDDYLVKPVLPGHLQARLVIAERRLALARARRAAVEEAATLRWLAGIGQTVLTLQHEVNNPLTALFGCLEALGSADLPPGLAEEVAVAASQAKRIADVIRRLSAAKHHETIEIVPGKRMLVLGPSPFVAGQSGGSEPST